MKKIVAYIGHRWFQKYGNPAFAPRDLNKICNAFINNYALDFTKNIIEELIRWKNGAYYIPKVLCLYVKQLEFGMSHPNIRE